MPRRSRGAALGCVEHDKRDLPAWQPRSGGDRFAIGRLVRRKRDEEDACGRDLMQEVVHHRLEAAGSVERDDAGVLRRQRPDIGNGRLTNHVRHRREALGAEHLERQPQGVLCRQEHVWFECAQPIHQARGARARECVACSRSAARRRPRCRPRAPPARARQAHSVAARSRR